MTYGVDCYLSTITREFCSGVVKTLQRSRGTVLLKIPFEHIWIHHVEFKSCNLDEFCEYTLVVLRLFVALALLDTIYEIQKAPRQSKS